jgi:hypothetical protein
MVFLWLDREASASSAPDLHCASELIATLRAYHIRRPSQRVAHPQPRDASHRQLRARAIVAIEQISRIGAASGLATRTYPDMPVA